MTTYTRPVVNGTPTTGQVVKAAHVNEPIDQIYDTILTGGITADQIAIGAVDTSELATAAVTAAKMDGTLPDASAMATSAAPTTDAQLVNKKYVDDNVGSANWTPTSYAGEESITFPNGLIFKQGTKTRTALNTTVTFAVAFSTITNGWACGGTNNDSFDIAAHTLTTTTMKVRANDPGTTTLRWFAIGY